LLKKRGKEVVKKKRGKEVVKKKRGKKVVKKKRRLLQKKGRIKRKP
jgi:hypothetical protein